VAQTTSRQQDTHRCAIREPAAFIMLTIKRRGAARSDSREGAFCHSTAARSLDGEHCNKMKAPLEDQGCGEGIEAKLGQPPCDPQADRLES